MIPAASRRRNLSRDGVPSVERKSSIIKYLLIQMDLDHLKNRRNKRFHMES